MLKLLILSRNIVVRVTKAKSQVFVYQLLTNVVILSSQIKRDLMMSMSKSSSVFDSKMSDALQLHKITIFQASLKTKLVRVRIVGRMISPSSQ